MIQRSAPAWDVIVVGAGPAGSVTSALLARLGRRVLLLDRSAFPRPKPCGESINPGAVGELRELGLLSLVEALPHRPITSWTIRPRVGAPFRGSFPSRYPGLAVDRGRLDAELVSWATAHGTQLREREQVVDLVLEDGRIAGVVTRDGRRHHARLVIGCDGLRSVVMRRGGLLRRPPVLRKAALTAHVRGAAMRSGEGELHFLPWGTAGIVEIEEDLANVVLVLKGPLRRDGEPVASLFDRLLSDVEPLRSSIRIGDVLATGPFDRPTRDVVTEGAMLVGDAAGYFDPFTGQGIYRALRGARLAAEAAEQALDLTPAKANAVLRDYAAAHRRAFSPGVLLQKLVEEATSRPPILAAFAGGLARIPAAADFIVRRTGDLPLGSSRRIPARI